MSAFLTRPLSIDAQAFVGPALPIRTFASDRPPSFEELVDGARGAAALLTLVSDPIGADVLEALPTVRHVAQVAVGYDNVDVDACRARDVLVTHTPGVLTDATADLTFALLLAVARRVREGEALLRGGHFVGWGPTMLLGMELSGRVLGIYGFGRIGQAVARRAVGFGMRVVYCSRADGPADLGERVDFETMLRISDVVSLHAPATNETHHAIDAAAMGAMKPGAILINTARGTLIDEAALADALDDGPLFGAGLDVYEDEPAVHPSLIARNDVVLLPHLGSATEAARRRMAETALADALAVFEGRPARFVVPELRAAAEPG